MDSAVYERLFTAAIEAAQDPFRRCVLAAPFAAAGLSSEEALARADALINKSIEDLQDARLTELDLKNIYFVSLDTVCERLNVKERSAIKKIEAAMAPWKARLGHLEIDGPQA